SDRDPIRVVIGVPTYGRPQVVDSENDVQGTAESDEAPTGSASPSSTAVTASAATPVRGDLPVRSPSGMAGTVGENRPRPATHGSAARHRPDNQEGFVACRHGRRQLGVGVLVGEILLTGEETHE